MKWEYQVLCRHDFDHEELDRMGGVGWELVSAFAITLGEVEGHTMVFKRLLPRKEAADG